jgi:hypothetical protein
MPHCREWFAPKAFVIRTLPPPAGAVRWWLVASITGQRRRVVGCHGLVIVVQQDSGTLDGVQRRPGGTSQVPTTVRRSPGRARRPLEPRSGTWLAALGDTTANTNTVSPNQCILSRSTQRRRRTPVMELRQGSQFPLTAAEMPWNGPDQHRRDGGERETLGDRADPRPAVTRTGPEVRVLYGTLPAAGSEQTGY